jgi:hypothetical protein
MWPWVLGSAALGGLQAYQESGGDIGKTLTGAVISGGLGSLVPGAGGLAKGAAVRLAGARLAPFLGSSISAAEAASAIPVIGKLIPAGATLAQKAALGAKITGGATKLAGAAGGLAKAGVGLAATAAIPKLASALSGAPGQAARAGGNTSSPLVGGAATYGTTYQPDATLPYVPALSQYGESVSKPYGIADVLKGPAAAARLEGYLERQMERAQMIRDAQAQYPILSQAKKDEMDRQLAAYQARRNIDVNADMISSSLHTAQQIGANAAAQMGQALAAQYSY